MDILIRKMNGIENNMEYIQYNGNTIFYTIYNTIERNCVQ